MSRPQPDPSKLSGVEHHKLDGDHLRGTITDTLKDADADHFEQSDISLLKFHGIYQQKDRDAKPQKVDGKLKVDYSFMIRIAFPGGVCTPETYLALNELGLAKSFGALRVTTRQAVQYHGVLKDDLKDVMNGINQALATTLAACGDIPRNMMASPAPFTDPAWQDATALARDLQLDLAPATGAYFDIWVDGEKQHLLQQSRSDTFNRSCNGTDEEPFYGKQYLPRKFKIGVALDVDNAIDVFANDCGLVAATELGEDGKRRITGFNLTVGGGFGMTHNKADTIARIGTVIGSVPVEHARAAVRTVVEVYRDHGNREDRKHARIKYLLEDWGVEKFREAFHEYVGWKLGEPIEMDQVRQRDHMGRHAQGDGRYFYGVWIENGRITDRADNGTPGPKYQTAFRKIVEQLRPQIRFTPMQSILFCNLDEAQADRVAELLREHHIPEVDELSNARRYSMACPALPTCGLAIAESERALPGVVDEIEAELTKLGLDDVELNIRMTGCPNGCARPYNADIGFVGRKSGVYNMYVGGGLGGDRIADLFGKDVKRDKVVETLRPLFVQFKNERTRGESLSDYYQRKFAEKTGQTERRTIVTGKETPTRDQVVDLTVEV